MLKMLNNKMFASDYGNRDGQGNSTGHAALAVSEEDLEKMIESIGKECNQIVSINDGNSDVKKGLEAMRDGWCSYNGEIAVNQAVEDFENITAKIIFSYKTMVNSLVNFSNQIMTATGSYYRASAKYYAFDGVNGTKINYDVQGLKKWNGHNLISAVKFDQAKNHFKNFQEKVSANFEDMVEHIEKNARLTFVPPGYEEDAGIETMEEFVAAIKMMARRDCRDILSEIGEIIGKLDAKLAEKEQDVLDAISYGNQIYPGK